MAFGAVVFASEDGIREVDTNLADMRFIKSVNFRLADQHQCTLVEMSLPWSLRNEFVETRYSQIFEGPTARALLVPKTLDS